MIGKDLKYLIFRVYVQEIYIWLVIVNIEIFVI